MSHATLLIRRNALRLLTPYELPMQKLYNYLFLKNFLSFAKSRRRSESFCG